ncbi:MAG: hypothetical protein DMF84_17065 [Acidobacteria bacterium]|nr:MAG: hypothetical protein DMF84_17065 [Acidobacteriota bacterium]
MTTRGAAPGQRGARGSRGARGITGAQGKVGPRGATGPATSRADILTAVGAQLREIDKQLATQLTRTGQIQAQLDKQGHNGKALQQQLKMVHALLKELLRQDFRVGSR